MSKVSRLAERRKMLEVLERFRIIIKSIRHHYREVQQRAGLSGAHIWALAEVAKRPGCTVGDLARALAIHQSTASHLLRRLEGLGLLVRHRRGKDQRQVQLQASKQGFQVLRHAPQPLIGVLQQALSQLPAEALHDLHKQLGRVIQLMKVKTLSARATPLSEM